jgi:hypothetical protein
MPTVSIIRVINGWDMETGLTIQDLGWTKGEQGEGRDQGASQDMKEESHGIFIKVTAQEALGLSNWHPGKEQDEIKTVKDVLKTSKARLDGIDEFPRCSPRRLARCWAKW